MGAMYWMLIAAMAAMVMVGIEGKPSADKNMVVKTTELEKAADPTAPKIEIYHWTPLFDGTVMPHMQYGKMEETPYNTRIHQYTFAPGTSFETRSYPHVVLLGIATSNLELHMYGLTVTMVPGDVVFVPENVAHSYTVVGDEDLVMHISAK